MIVVFAVLLLVVMWFLVRRHRRRANADAAVRPLAGIDTGFRSAYSAPGRFFRHRRGF